MVDKVGPQDARYVGIQIRRSVKLANTGINRANDVVAALIKRLAHRNVNVQLYTLEVGWF